MIVLSAAFSCVGLCASAGSAAVVFDSTYVVGNVDTTGDTIALDPRMISNLNLDSSSSSLALNSITTQQGYTNSGAGSLTLNPTVVIKFYTPAPANGASTAADITASMTLLGTITYALPQVTLGAGQGQVSSTTIPGNGIVIPKNVAVSTYYYDTSDTSVNASADQMHTNIYGWGYFAGGLPNVGTAAETYWDLDNNGLLAGGEEETIGGFFTFVPSFVIDASPASVPEPTSVAMLACCAPALMARRRRA